MRGMAGISSTHGDDALAPRPQGPEGVGEAGGKTGITQSRH